MRELDVAGLELEDVLPAQGDAILIEEIDHLAFNGKGLEVVGEVELVLRAEFFVQFERVVLELANIEGQIALRALRSVIMRNLHT